MFSIEELKGIQGLCDLGLRHGGLEAVNLCVPLASKCGKLIQQIQAETPDKPEPKQKRDKPDKPSKPDLPI